MRFAFLGTSDFAVTVLRRLVASEHRPALVVAPPNRRRGRGRKVTPPPAAEAARELGLELHQTESVNLPETVERLRAAALEVGVVCDFGQLIKAPLLDELELLNVHPSLLPRWRGAAPIERAIIAGDAETGVTIMRVTAGLDSGPIALQRRVPIEPGEDFATLAVRLGELGGELAAEALDRRARGELQLVDQDDSLATYAEKIAPEERRLDPSRPADELERVVRALNPHIGTYVELEGGERLGVRAATAEGEGAERRPAEGDGDIASGAPRPGELEAADGQLRLGCGGGVLRLVEVQPPGRRPMPADAYLRGHPAPVVARS